MPQDNQTPIPEEAPKASRRALLFGIAAVGAVASPAVAAAMLEPQALLSAPAPAVVNAVEVDPIFALIEQHRAALREEKRTSDIFEQHADELEDDNNRGVVVGERPDRSTIELVRSNEEAIRFNYPPKMAPVFVFDEKALAGYAPIELRGEERAAWIKDKTKELRRNRRAYAKRNKNTPRAVAFKAWNEADKVTDGLSKQLIETSPTTVAGVAAVLAHWSKVMDEDEHDRDFISTTEFLQSLAKGVKAIG
jgi:hypothetical protein